MTRTHELDHDRDHDAYQRPTDPARAPGRGTRAQDLDGPTGALPSGIVMRKQRDSNGVEAGAEHALSQASSSSSGRGLPDPLRDKFEQSLGADLSAVRIHDGAASAASASAVGAKAYTVGNDIHFGAGHYDPTSSAGEHLLAHEVAHTVQQSGGIGRKAQFKLEVSSPGDAHEVEADRAADAMIAGSKATVGGADAHVARAKNEMEQMAIEGESDVANQVAAAAPAALVVSNVRDQSSAQALLNQLQSNQPLLEQGVSQGEVDEANLTENGAVITDLQMYLSAANQQGVSISNFQRAYAQLLLDFGRLDGLCKRYADTSIHSIGDVKSAQDMVDMQVDIDGNDADDLKGLVSKLKAEPAIQGQLDTIHGLVLDLDALSEKVQTGSQKSATAIARVGAATTRLRAATNAFGADELATVLAPVKEKAAKTAEITQAITSCLSGKATEVGKQATSGRAATASVKGANGDPVEVSGTTGTPNVQFTGSVLGGTSSLEINGAGLGKLLLGGLSGGATGLLTVAADEVWKLVKPKLDKLVEEMNISIGDFPDKREETAESKRKQALYDDVKAATDNLRNEKDGTQTSFKDYFTDAQSLEGKKGLLRASLNTFGSLIEERSKALGKSKSGKKLHELTALVGEAQAFIEQGKLCVKMGEDELDAGNQATGAGTARARLNDFNQLNGRVVHLATKWYGTKERLGRDARKLLGFDPSDEDQAALDRQQDPNRAEHISVSSTRISIDSASNSTIIDATNEEVRGLGSADSAGNRRGLGANEVLRSAVDNARDIVAKASAYVQALNALVFDGALSTRS
jgi:hypothetical protein